MRIYRLSFWDSEEGHLLEWHASKAAAEKALRRLRREKTESGPIRISAVEFPTRKREILKWLNENLQHDHG